MTFAVKEIFLTLQGEGLRAGRRAVFCRFAGCNLWSGREQDRAQAVCQFCDTDFVGTDGVGGGKFANADALGDAIAAAWGDGRNHRYVVLTGGEPMLQIDDALVDALHARGFDIAIESNGTLPVHPGIDWVCISPKAGSDIVQRTGDELKLVWPQAGWTDDDVAIMETWDFTHHLVQPMDCGASLLAFPAGKPARDLLAFPAGKPARLDSPQADVSAVNADALHAATQFALTRPKWKLSLQMHKMLGLQ